MLKKFTFFSQNLLNLNIYMFYIIIVPTKDSIPSPTFFHTFEPHHPNGAALVMCVDNEPSDCERIYATITG